MNTQEKRILLIHTGGTFGMRVDAESDQVLPSSEEFLGEIFSYVPELRRLAELELRVLCSIDSSDMNVRLWQKLAETIIERWEHFDGFVIIHGTDTMAYTGAALSLALSSLTKPIVLTGSQRPLHELRSDARANIIDAVELAASGIPEVMICFDSHVHRGTRVTKYSCEHLRAFRAYNSELLGRFGVHFAINTKLARKIVPELNRHPPVYDGRFDPNIISLDAIPGVGPSDVLIEAIVNSHKGIILRGFGSGNLPTHFPAWLQLCEEALARRIPVVMASQCMAGSVNLESYAAGRAFFERGVISGRDMSFETIAVKLMAFLGRGIEFEKRHQFFATPLAFEVS